MSELLMSWVRSDPRTLQDVAQYCLDRCRITRWHETNSAQLATEFFLGAAIGAATCGNNTFADEIAWVAANIVAKQGMVGVQAIADGHNRILAA